MRVPFAFMCVQFFVFHKCFPICFTFLFSFQTFFLIFLSYIFLSGSILIIFIAIQRFSFLSFSVIFFFSCLISFFWNWIIYIKKFSFKLPLFLLKTVYLFLPSSRSVFTPNISSSPHHIFSLLPFLSLLLSFVSFHLYSHLGFTLLFIRFFNSCI